jgi:hypothetical protein
MKARVAEDGNDPAVSMLPIQKSSGKSDDPDREGADIQCEQLRKWAFPKNDAERDYNAKLFMGLVRRP